MQPGWLSQTAMIGIVLNACTHLQICASNALTLPLASLARVLHFQLSSLLEAVLAEPAVRGHRSP